MTEPDTTDCVTCGAAIGDGPEPGNPASRYCSNACRQRAYRWRLKVTGLGNASSASLQSQMNSFVGRVDELVEVARLVREARLVTLTGPPGVGKTRLAGEFAAQEQRGGRCEVVVVELATLTGGRAVRDLIETTLRESLEHKGSAARHGGGDHNRLLVLDNCEHVLDDCSATLVDLLARYPKVRALATSREPLRLPGEVVFPVRCLPTPAADGSGAPIDVIRLPVVRLFFDRARSVLPEFQLTEDNVTEVGVVCAQLDGLPLAIELAAGLVRAFPVAEIRRRMADRLDLLAGGWRTAEPRHGSLRAAFDWSHGLLTDDEQVLFRTLSVLPRGFGADIATAVAAGQGLAAACVPKLLVALEAKSLITRVAWTSADARFQMLGSVRCYAREQLADHGEQDRAHGLVVRWLIEATDGFPDTGVLTSKAVGRLMRERDCLAAELERLGTGADPDQLVLAAASDVLGMVTGAAPGAHRELTGALDRVAAGSDGYRVALATEAVLAAWRGEHRTAKRLAGEVLSSKVDAQRGRMTTLLTLVGRMPAAGPTMADLRECLHGDDLREDPMLAALCLYAAAEQLVYWQDAAAGARLIGECSDLLPMTSLPGPLRTLLHATGALALEAGDLHRAEEYFTRMLRESDHIHHTALALEGLAVRAISARRCEHGLRLLAAAETMGGSGAHAAADWWRQRVETANMTARQTLPSAQSNAALTYGQSLSSKQAVSYALDTPPTDQANQPSGDTLSEREWEVAALVAQGLTNRQIGARLYVSVRTVETHVRNIRTVLGLNTRAHIAAWTAERRRPVRVATRTADPNHRAVSIAV